MTTTIAHMLAKAHSYRGELDNRPYQNARKALLRIAAAAGRHPGDVVCDDLLAAHYAATTRTEAISEKHEAEERTHLRRLIDLPDIDPSVAERIFAGTATLRDAHDLAVERGDTKARLSALTRVIGHLEKARPTAVLRADGRTLNKLLDGITFTDLDVSKPTWASYRTAVRRAAERVDMTAQQTLKVSMLTGDWAVLCELVKPRREDGRRSGLGHHQAKIWPLVRYCYPRSIPAAQVNDHTIQDLWAELEHVGAKNPKNTVQSVIYSWEALQRRFPDVWPATRLSRIYSKGRQTFQTPFEDLPETLKTEWQAYAEARFARPGPRNSDPGRLSDLVHGAPRVSSPMGQDYDDPLADIPDHDEDLEPGADERAVVVRRCAKALPNMRTAFTYLANAAIHERGFTPTSIRDLFTHNTRGVMKGALSLLHRNQQARADAEGVSRPQIRNNTTRKLVSDALAIARDLRMPEDVLQRIDAFYDHVHPDFKKRVTDPATGETRREWHSGFRMSPRRQQLIAHFGETGGHARFAAWHRLPVVYRDRAKQALRRVRGQAHRLTDEQLNDGATAVAAAIVRCGALRRGSLETLRLADHPTEPERPANVYVPIRREKDVFARFDLAPVDIKKNGKPLHLLANAFCTEVLIWFRDHIRPELLRRRGSDPTNPYLFPGEGLRPRPEGKLTRDYARRAREQGFELDLHTNRALIGKIILDRDPSQMALVQQVLGHENIETTQSYYAAVNSLVAQKVWQKHLHEAERESFQTLGAATLRLAK